MIGFISNLPIWELIRLSGFLSYLLLLFGISLGILYSYPFSKGKIKKRIFGTHKLMTNTGTALALLHGILPVISPYMPFTWTEVLVPFAAHNHRILIGIGTLAAYGLLLLLFTTDIRQKLGRKLWYLTHLLSYPMFIIVWVHGYFLGTDTGLLGMRWMYLLSLLLLALLTIGRGLFAKPGRRTSKPPLVA